MGPDGLEMVSGGLIQILGPLYHVVVVHPTVKGCREGMGTMICRVIPWISSIIHGISGVSHIQYLSNDPLTGTTLSCVPSPLQKGDI